MGKTRLGGKDKTRTDKTPPEDRTPSWSLVTGPPPTPQQPRYDTRAMTEPLLPVGGDSAQPSPDVAPTGYRRPAHLVPYPYLSLAERDRRWQTTWRVMEQHALDCIVVAPSTNLASPSWAYARYITQVGGMEDHGVAVVLPLGVEPTVVAPDAEGWRQLQPWCTNIQEQTERTSEAVLAILRETTLTRRRIGIVSPDPYIHGHQGPGTARLRELAAELDVSCVDFTPLLDAVRLVKSPEEIAFLEQSGHIAAVSLRRAAAAAQPGVSDREIWGTTIEAALSLGSDSPVRLRTASGRQSEGWTHAPGPGTVEPPWLHLTRLETSWGGYRAQCEQPIGCGPTSPVFADMMHLAGRAWDTVALVIAPGCTIGMLNHALAHAIEELRPRSGPLATTTATGIIQGCGLGHDQPRAKLGRRTDSADNAYVIPLHACFFLAVRVTLETQWLSWGDSVVVKAEGARRLGDNPQAILIGPDFGL